MNRKILCNKIDSCTYLLNIYQNGYLVSTGTAICVNKSGDLLTAAHVITGNFPAKKSDTINITILGKNTHTKIQEYSIAICGMSVKLEIPDTTLHIDLALLKNINPDKNIKYKYLPYTEGVPEIGDDVLMCGFSDEINHPFTNTIDTLIDSEKEYYDENNKVLSNYDVKTLKSLWFKFPIVKSGMVGRVFQYEFTEDINKYHGADFYVDNVMHSGASGGAVINSIGSIVGIITQRATIVIDHDFDFQLKKDQVRAMQKITTPSGSTIAVTPQIVIELYRNTINMDLHIKKDT